MKMKFFLSKYEPEIYAALRIITGFLFLWHGSQKFFNFPPAGHPFPGYVAAIGGTVEFVGGLLVMFGLFTRVAAFICSGEMAYAYWTVHASHAVLPIVNMGEPAVVYCFLFLFISARGAGIFSLDKLLEKRS